MPKLQQKVLRYDLLQSEQTLRQTESLHGKNSPEHQAAQRKLIRLWALLKMTHPQEDFLSEVQAIQS